MIDDSTSAERTKEFILKLACSDDGEGCIESIAEQFHGIEQNPFFPYVFDELDPDNFNSEMKLLDESSRDVLRRAYDLYSQKYQR